MIEPGEGKLPEKAPLKPQRPLNPIALAVLQGRSDVDLSSGASISDAISQGGSVTAGLRKVSKEEMTHKNPELRASSLVPGTAAAPSAAVAAPKAKACITHPHTHLSFRKITPLPRLLLLNGHPFANSKAKNGWWKIRWNFTH